MKTISLDKNKIHILLLEGVDPSAVDAFRDDGYGDIEYHPKSLPERQLLAAVRNAAFIVYPLGNAADGSGFRGRPEKLVGVGCFCIGTNQVDLAAAQQKGVPVFNAPFSNTRSVAELVLSETIFLMRGVPWRNALAHRGGWAKTASGSHEVRGKCLGIVGYGHIGTQVGLLAESLGMRVVFHDVETQLALGNATQAPSLEALLGQADVVTFHVPETPITHNMIGAAEISGMKPGAKLINASRGTVVVIDALAAALKSGPCGSGGSSTCFPKGTESRRGIRLAVARNGQCAPDAAYRRDARKEAQRNIGKEVADKLIRYSNNGSTLAAVNFPEVSLPAHSGKHRILHIHRNQPGVLSGINAIFSEDKINIAAEYLQTNAQIGYVVIDLDPGERGSTAQLRK